MKKTIFMGISVSLVILGFSGCGSIEPTPMTKKQVLEITKGDTFKPQYVVYWDKVSFRCLRLNEEWVEISNQLWNKGTYKEWELYDYKRNDWYYGTFFSVQSIKSSLNDLRIYENRQDCQKYAEPKGSSNSVDVYVH